jgi:hypothetical protein
MPGAELVFICSRAPEPEVMEHYFSLMRPDRRADARRRCRVLAVHDERPRPVAAKLLARPDLLDTIREIIGERPAFIDPWNVGKPEVDLAVTLQVPINGTDPALWPLGFKSAGRRILAAAAVPCPAGVEDVHTPDEVLSAVEVIRRHRPEATGVVVKHDDSGSGDGNAIIDLSRPPDASVTARAYLHRQLMELGDPYLDELKRGGVVEELVSGDEVASPSVQVTIGGDAKVNVHSVHDQLLGGPAGHTYQGCRFPADPAYAGALARHGQAVGERLRDLGAIGRFSVDFMASRPAGGDWSLHALEINLRKGGTTHPFGVLRNLVPGAFVPDTGQYRSEAGPSKHYWASDNLVDPAWLGLPAARVIAALEAVGLAFDWERGTGVVPHMLSCLAIDGRFGITAIADSHVEADALVEAARSTVHRLSRSVSAP